MRINKSFIALTSSDASVAWSNITGTPTTLSGYGITDGVPTSRTLTINGVTYDLSANRSWTITAGGSVTSVDMSVPTGFAITGNPITTSGTLALAFASGYSLPTTAKQTEWDTAYTNRITSLTTTGSSGAATLTSNTLNIPNYTLSGLGGVPTTRTLTINGTAYDLSSDRSWSVGTVTSVGLSSATSGVTIGSTPVTSSGTITLTIDTASGSQNGLLSSTDWTTFNSKQPQLNGTGFVKATGTTITYDNSTYLTTSSASSTYLPLAGGTLTGQLITTLANNTATGGGQIYLNGANGNRIDFGTSGVAAPSFTTRSVGTKILLYPDIGVAKVDYAIGIDYGYLWNSVPLASDGFKWYGGTTNIATLTGAGAATFSSSVTAGTFLTNAASGTGGQEGFRINNDNGYIGFFNGANTTRSAYIQGNTTDLTLSTSLATPILFYTSNAEKMRLTANGRLLLGTTTEATYLLDVNGSARFGYVAGAVALRVTRGSSDTLDFYQGGGVSYIDSSAASSQLVLATVGVERLRINATGVTTIANLSGTGTRMVVADSSGVLSASTIVTSDTYTPTITNVGNVTSSSISNTKFFYTRVGSYVHVSGAIVVTPTVANNATYIAVSLPVSSNLGSADVNGIVISYIYGYGYVQEDAINDRAELFFQPNSTTAGQMWKFEFTYRIV